MTTTWLTLAELTHPGAAIRERRIELGWTQTELATRTGIPQADISRIENGHLDARWSTIQRISTELAHTTTPHKRSLANGNKIHTNPNNTHLDPEPPRPETNELATQS
jgi:predicted transcriptional regulator